ncbi:uncharacterized protein [Gorilla gorilla gorilla]|uniref:uncharacterized protein n=1 Tax=Gorilla gorilla gorilla TaxID=9595 RepID=UPI0001FA6061
MGSGAEPVTVTVLFREEGRRNQCRGRLSSVDRRCPHLTGSMTLGEWELRKSRDVRVNCSPGHRWRPEPSSLRAPGEAASAVCGCCPPAALGPHGTWLSPAPQGPFLLPPTRHQPPGQVSV